MGAGRALSAGRKGTQVFASFMTASANGTAGVVSAEGCQVSIGLAVSALCAPSIWDVVIQLAFTVAYDKVLVTDRSLLDTTRQCHENRGVRFMLAALCGCQPAWCLSLYQLQIVGSDTVRDLGY